jgi:hypothetical protein
MCSSRKKAEELVASGCWYDVCFLLLGAMDNALVHNEVDEGDQSTEAHEDGTGASEEEEEVDYDEQSSSGGEEEEEEEEEDEGEEEEGEEESDEQSDSAAKATEVAAKQTEQEEEGEKKTDEQSDSADKGIDEKEDEGEETDEQSAGANKLEDTSVLKCIDWEDSIANHLKTELCCRCALDTIGASTDKCTQCNGTVHAKPKCFDVLKQMCLICADEENNRLDSIPVDEPKKTSLSNTILRAPETLGELSTDRDYDFWKNTLGAPPIYMYRGEQRKAARVTMAKSAKENIEKQIGSERVWEFKSSINFSHPYDFLARYVTCPVVSLPHEIMSSLILQVRRHAQRRSRRD